VLEGLFSVAEKLFGVRIAERKGVPLYHADAHFFEILDAGGEVRAGFYLDACARAKKRAGAWMDDCVGRKDFGAEHTVPVAYLVCNFLPAAPGKPALLTHDDVVTMFHEFGHGLHHMLTRVGYPSIAGINGVSWDAVELPSQFMENFCWEWDVVEPMTRHVDTGARIPRALFNRMIAAKHFQRGLGFVRQLEFALFDMRLHAPEFDPASGDVMALLAEVRRQVAVYAVPDYNRFPNQFSHIFAGGYAAGYYSYKWAEVLSSDAYGAFEEGGVLNPEIGARFRREVLAAGGSRPALESFVAFRGRKPQIDALLRHNGMTLPA